ncbi:MAG: TonB-dependent receptor [Pseudomonadota bacterium]
MRDQKTSRFNTSLLASVVSSLSIIAAAPVAAAQSAPSAPVARSFSLPAGPLGDALFAITSAFDVNIIADERLVQGKSVPALSGLMTANDAIEQVLKNTGLKAERSPNGAFVITQQSAPVRQDTLLRITPKNEAEGLATTDTIVVTGTNIRGLVPESTPLRIIDRREIEASGAGSTRDFLRTLPQNFGGGADDSFPFNLPGDATVGEDFSEGTSVNLRGLGAGSTLTLINGRRIAPSSNVGAYTDISIIPLSAIQRIEVLSDGASAIYGSDAIAGVANFVLRDDYKGVEVTGRYGTVTGGGLDEYRANITAGTTWGSGNGLFTYEYYSRNDLDVSERVFSATVPSLNTLLPTRDRHSVLVSASQSLTPNLEVGVDALYSRRRTTRFGFENDGVAPRIDRSSNESLAIGGDLEWEISEHYSLRVIGNYSTLETIAGSDLQDPGRFNSGDTITADAILNGSILDLPGGSLRFASGAQYRRETFVNLDGRDRLPFADGTRDVYAVFGEIFVPVVGPETNIPGVRRLEFNVSGRYEDYSDFGSSTDPKIGLLYSPIEGLKFRGTYSTSFRPPALGRTGATDREIRIFGSAAVNDLFGATPADPSVADVAILELLGTGTDLEAEKSESWTLGFDYDLDWRASEFAFGTTYFNTVFDGRINTPPVPGGLNFLAVNEFIRDPGALVPGTVIPSPTQAEINDVVSQANFPLVTFGTEAGVDEADFIVNSTTVNVSKTVVRGIDVDLRYNQPVGPGEISAGFNAAHILDFTQQGAPTVPVVDLLDTLYNPLDLNLRGQLGYQWGGFTGNGFINYADGYRTSSTEDGNPIGSYTTVDLSLTYSFQNTTQASFFNGTTLRFFVQNLFNEEPPQISENPVSVITAFDPANASALQRFIAFEVTKAF